MNNQLFKCVEYQYNMKVKKYKILKEYPHIFFLQSNNKYYLKKYNSADIVKNINSFYSNYAKEYFILEPVMTIYGEYYFEYNNEFYFLFRQLQQKRKILLRQWETILYNLHSLDTGKISNQQCKHYNYVSEIKTTKQFNSYKNVVINNKKIKKAFFYSINYLKNYILTNEKFVIVHGDLKVDNVLFEKNTAKLIDFDRWCFAPREYDVARLVLNMSFRRINFKKNHDFLDLLFNKYERCVKITLDFNLFSALLIIDACKNLCWLEDVFYGECNNKRLAKMLYYLRKNIYILLKEIETYGFTKC